MYCPECGVEYRDGFAECSDCHVALLAGAPAPEPFSAFDPDIDLVVVLDTAEGEGLAVKARFQTTGQLWAKQPHKDPEILIEIAGAVERSPLR